MTRPVALLIEWHDSVTTMGWQDIGKSGAPHKCVSVGFLDTETADYVVLAGTFSEADAAETNNRIAIPKGWITKRKVVRL